MRVLQEAVASAYDKVYGIEGTSYDATKWFVGKGIKYDTIDGVPVFTPMNQVMRPMEESTAFYTGYPNVYQKSSVEWYIFTPDTLVGATTRRIRLYTLNVKTGTVTSNGFITATKPVAGNGTVRDFKLDVYEYSTGTCSVSTATVTGSGTAWSTDRISLGARIGFGSTDPKQITTWYYINAVGSDTSLTLQTNSTASGTGGTAANISVGSGAYVIQEFRMVFIETNATTTNGGVFITKGTVPEDFTSGGTTIAAAVSTDKVKACYWLKDASTQTNIVSCGAGIVAQSSNTNRGLYVMDSPSAGNYKWYKYNIRAALTLATGASTSAFTLATGNNAVTGTISQNASMCIATTSHGAGSGVECIYALTTTRFLRIPLTNITSGNTACVSDSIIEVPPGGTSTYAATSAMSNIEYSPTLDRFYITTTTYWYLTKFVSSGTQFDRHFGRTILNLDQSLAESDLPDFFAPNGTSSSLCSITGTGIVLACKQGTTSANNQIYALSAGADKDFAIANNAVLVSPKMTLTDASQFFRAYVAEKRWLGSNEHTMAPEPYLVYFRTQDIDTDMTSSWQLLDAADDLSSFSGTTECQFRIVFQTLGISCLPSQIISVAVAYDNYQTDTHYSLSETKSVAASQQFVWRHVTMFGTTVPTLYFKLYDAETGSLILSDDSVALAYGTLERSTDGTSWSSFSTSDRASGSAGDNTYIRYTPTATLNGKIRAVVHL